MAAEAVVARAERGSRQAAVVRTEMHHTTPRAMSRATTAAGTVASMAIGPKIAGSLGESRRTSPQKKMMGLLCSWRKCAPWLNRALVLWRNRATLHLAK
ncbi:hypothetical protein E2562_022995 [Oryza meyeriana var. granulata]|uniref:Uncharacterized protein n=1 Tax=Oryza meyeriana var. granulata TaxID=110450 RepID=A0A6G1EYB7_9ORYZ|nr:hypothetical protein E2562_022995 [Oryza meyeriana var. granulata]